MSAASQKVARVGATSIALTGMMGTGKTVVGRLLATRLGWSFVDTDPQVEQTAGKSVAEIFAQDGEAAFRRLERHAVEEALGRPGSVVSLGGGAVLDPATRHILCSRGITIWLQADIATCAARAAGEGRPLLQGKDPLVMLERILDQRRALYAEVADLEIDTGPLDPDEVVNCILDEIGTRSTGAHP